MEKFQEVTIEPRHNDCDVAVIAGFNPGYAYPPDARERSPFYAINCNPFGYGYVYSAYFAYDLSVGEIREYFPEATLEELFSLQKDWIVQSFRLQANPLPILRKKFPEYKFYFSEAMPLKGESPTMVRIPPEGSSLWVNRAGQIWVREIAPELE